MSTPGHATSGADGVGEAGWVTPGVARENKLVNRLPNEESADPTLEADEQPAGSRPASNSAAAFQPARSDSVLCPGHIEITRLFCITQSTGFRYTSETMAAPRP